ncbi:6192_t:CDS:1, partial [Dentiscutata erythropus]
IFDDKANEWRNYAICCVCCDAVGKPAAIIQKFPNKSDQVKNHLKKCKHFIEEQGGIEVAFKILDI